MASHICTIQVKNKWKRCRFSVALGPHFEQIDEVTRQGFQPSPPIEAQADGSSTATFKIDNTCFAIHGTTTDGKTINISTQASRKVKLGPGGSVVGITMQDGAVVWDDASTNGNTIEEKGVFAIKTDGSIQSHGGDRIFVGVGLADPCDSGQVVPYGTLTAFASKTYKILPQMNFVLTASHYDHGDLIEIIHAVVDFNDCQVPKAFVTVEEGRLVDDGDRSKQNGVKILPYGSSDISDAIHVEEISG